MDKNSLIQRSIKTTKLTALLCSCAFLLFSCAGSENTAKENKSAPQTTSVKTSDSNAPEKAGVSNKLDACAVVPKAEVEKILGSAVKSAELSRVTEGTTAAAAFSTCTYKLENGQQIEFFARRSPVADNTPGAWNKLRDTMQGFSNLVDVPEAGDRAFWIGKMKQLHVFSGENIYIYITANNFKTESEAKTKAVEFALIALKNLS